MPDAENLLAHLKPLLDVLLNLGVGVVLVETRARTERPNLLLALGVGVDKLGCDLVVERQVGGDVLRLLFSQLLTR